MNALELALELQRISGSRENERSLNPLWIKASFGPSGET